MRATKRLVVLALVVILGAPGPAAGADAARVTVSQIRLSEFPVLHAYVSVADTSGEPVAGLSATAFEVREGHSTAERVDVTGVRTAGDSLAVVLALDRSGSMKTALSQAIAAAHAFIADVAPEDLVGLVAFDDRVSVLLAPTADRAAAASALRGVTLGRDTALHDGLAAGIRLLAETTARRKAIVVLTDGKENRSTTTAGDVVARARAKSIAIHTIALGNEVDAGALDRLATATGGLRVASEKPEDLVAVYRRIAALMASQYVVTFKSPAKLDRAWHDVTVAVTLGGGRLEGRLGYLATLDGGPDTRAMRDYLARQARDRWIVVVAGLGIVMVGLMTALALAARRGLLRRPRTVSS